MRTRHSPQGYPCGRRKTAFATARLRHRLASVALAVALLAAVGCGCNAPPPTWPIATTLETADVRGTLKADLTTFCVQVYRVPADQKTHVWLVCDPTLVGKLGPNVFVITPGQADGLIDSLAASGVLGSASPDPPPPGWYVWTTGGKRPLETFGPWPVGSVKRGSPEVIEQLLRAVGEDQKARAALEKLRAEQLQPGR